MLAEVVGPEVLVSHVSSEATTSTEPSSYSIRSWAARATGPGYATEKFPSKPKRSRYQPSATVAPRTLRPWRRSAVTSEDWKSSLWSYAVQPGASTSSLVSAPLSTVSYTPWAVADSTADRTRPATSNTRRRRTVPRLSSIGSGAATYPAVRSSSPRAAVRTRTHSLGPPSPSSPLTVTRASASS